VSFFEVYLFFGIPAIALAIGFGALWLTKPTRKKQRQSP
jgi:hypothetical protein